MVPAFFRLAGDRFTVMRLTGNVIPQFFTAARTRSRASRTAASGSPTMSKAGSPPDRKHSTLTSYPATPFRPRERVLITTAAASFLLIRQMPALLGKCRKNTVPQGEPLLPQSGGPAGRAGLPGPFGRRIPACGPENTGPPFSGLAGYRRSLSQTVSEWNPFFGKVPKKWPLFCPIRRKGNRLSKKPQSGSLHPGNLVI